MVAASHHAAAAGDARASLGTIAREIRIGIRLAAVFSFGRFEDRHVGPVERMADAGVVGRLFEEVVGRAEDTVLDDAERPYGRFVMARHLAFPVGQSGPRAVVPPGVLRSEERR